MINIRKLEAELWESADLLRAGSKLTSNQYCMPVLGLIFLRYAYSRFKLVEAEILKNRPVRNGRVLPVEAIDFASKSALFLPREAQYEYLLNLPENIPSANLIGLHGMPLNSLGEVVNNAMELVESQSEQLSGVLPKDYTMFSDTLLRGLLRIFNNSALNDVDGDIIGRIYEYFLNKFAKNIAQDDGVFFTPKSLVKMIVNVLEPKGGILLDPACGSGGMFVQTGDFVNAAGMEANSAMTFYGQEKVEYNAKLCLMNMAVHGLNGLIKSGDEANTFYHDAHSLDGCCDYVMANPPFNVDKVNSETTSNAGRLPFGLPAVNKAKEVGNGNYLWISYFYSYLNEKGRAGFVMASSATDSSGKDRDIRQRLVETGHVDVMMSVGNNFFYTKSLPCSIWFFDKGKAEAIQGHVLFIDARNYYTVVDRTLNEWSEWQLKNLNAIVWLYRGETEKYKKLLDEYLIAVRECTQIACCQVEDLLTLVPPQFSAELSTACATTKETAATVQTGTVTELRGILDALRYAADNAEKSVLKYAGDIAKEDKKQLANYFEFKTYREYEKKLEVHTALTAQYIDDVKTIISELIWLVDKFGIGKYQDIPGLCKMASRSEIAEKNYSLTPGAYVGVATVEDDGVDFAQRMSEIHRELLTLQAESNELMQTISKNMKEMGL